MHLCLPNPPHDPSVRKEVPTFLSAGGLSLETLALAAEELMNKAPFGLAASYQVLELFGRPGINNFGNAVGNRSNFGVHS